MMDIHAKVKEVQDYFKEKMLAWDVKITGCSYYEIDILIDSYPFQIWIANEDYGVRVVSKYETKSLMTIPFTEKEKKIIWENYMKSIGAAKIAEAEKIEKREYERLKQKYESKN